MHHDPDACRALASELAVPVLAHVSVITQHPIARIGGRIDCEIHLSQAAELHVVWIEVKAGATEQPEQLQRYATELHRRYGDRGTLVALASPGDKLLASADRPLLIDGEAIRDHTATKLTWPQLGALLDRVGTERGGRCWRTEAQREDTPTMQRRLADVLDYFEWEGLVAENDPITSSDAHVASRAHGLLDEKTGAIARLLDLATANVDVFRGEPVGRWHGGTWQGRTTPWRNGWPAELNAGGETYVWLTFAPTDEYERSEPRSEPAFLAAISFEPATPDTILCLMDPVWQTPDDVLVRQVDRRTVRVTKLIYLSELAVQGVTLTHQAEKLGEWADGALAELSQLRDPRLSASA